MSWWSQWGVGLSSQWHVVWQYRIHFVNERLWLPFDLWGPGVGLMHLTCYFSKSLRNLSHRFLFFKTLTVTPYVGPITTLDPVTQLNENQWVLRFEFCVDVKTVPLIWLEVCQGWSVCGITHVPFQVTLTWETQMTGGYEFGSIKATLLCCLLAAIIASP